MRMSLRIRANHILHSTLRLDDHAPRLGHRVGPQRAFDQAFEFRVVGGEENGRTRVWRRANGRLKDDVDVPVDQLLVDSCDEFGF